MDHNFEKLLDELHRLVLIEEEARSLTGDEIKRYIEIVDILKSNSVEIPFELSFDLDL